MSWHLPENNDFPDQGVPVLVLGNKSGDWSGEPIHFVATYHSVNGEEWWVDHDGRRVMEPEKWHYIPEH